MRESLCLPEAPRRQCKDINMESFNLALSLASQEARERFEASGIKLVFDDDSVSPWGPGWEFQFNLHYETINSTHTRSDIEASARSHSSNAGCSPPP